MSSLRTLPRETELQPLKGPLQTLYNENGARVLHVLCCNGESGYKCTAIGAVYPPRRAKEHTSAELNPGKQGIGLVAITLTCVCHDSVQRLNAGVAESLFSGSHHRPEVESWAGYA
jgi:hypothetical protein